MEFFIGGLSSCGACLFTNPLEVAKTRQQLQGELLAKGQYTVHYRNVLHAFYTIGRVEGIVALQKGLPSALCYQFVMNGFRLGAYQCFENLGLTRNDKGGLVTWKCVVAGAVAGSIGALFGSPFYMVKTHLQALSNQSIAVGYQHQHQGTLQAFRTIYKQYGVKGLWRGASGAIPRVTIGSAAQLSTFTKSREHVEKLQILPANSLWTVFVASIISGAVVVVCMTPFDVVSTRLYNQGVDGLGKGLLYKGVLDCFSKIFHKEGLWGFYKGWGASLFRLGPHTVLSLVFWTELRKVYLKAKYAS